MKRRRAGNTRRLAAEPNERFLFFDVFWERPMIICLQRSTAVHVCTCITRCSSPLCFLEASPGLLACLLEASPGLLVTVLVGSGELVRHHPHRARDPAWVGTTKREGKKRERGKLKCNPFSCSFPGTNHVAVRFSKRTWVDDIVCRPCGGLDPYWLFCTNILVIHSSSTPIIYDDLFARRK